MSTLLTEDEGQYTDAPYRRGYQNPSQLRRAVADAHATRIWRTGSQALFDHASVPVVLIAASLPAVRDAGSAVFLPALAIAVLVAARQLRALENLIHEASHYNWSRMRRRTGDLLASTLGGFPTGARIEAYRASHLVHHGRFGTSYDPDRQRYEELGLEDLDRSSLIPYLLGMARRFGPYQWGWLRTLGSTPLATTLPLMWCVLEILLPGWAIGGVGTAVAAGISWLITQLIALPALRFVAESSEHIYRGTDTVFEATISNLGLVQRLVIHPHGDGYHTIHHMWPGVTHHRIARLHRLLLDHDEQYRRNLRYRTGVLQRPKTGWEKSG